MRQNIDTSTEPEGLVSRPPHGAVVQHASVFENWLLALSESGEGDLARRRKLLVVAFSIIGLFQLASLFTAQWTLAAEVARPRRFAIPSYLLIAEGALTALALCAACLLPLKRRWRGWVFGYCVSIIAIRTAMCLVADEDEPLVMALFVVMLSSATFVPWTFAWQAMLGAISMVAFTAASFVGVIELSDAERWVILAVTTAFGLSFCALKQTYVRQRRLILALREGEDRLRTEIVERRGIEDRLRLEVVEREAAEAAARDDQAALKKLFDSSLDAIIVHELATGRLLYVNKEFTTFGYSRENAIGQPLQALQLFSKRSTYVVIDERLRVHGRIRNLEVDVRTVKGEIVPSLLSSAVVEMGGKPCAVSSIRDIAARKQMEGELIAAREAALGASKAKSEFLSSMSHEIRTPMNAVLGMAELLSETELGTEQRRYLDVMVANGNSLLELINSVLDLARIESGRMQIEKTEFDLVELIDQTISTFGVRAHGKGLELMARLSPGVPHYLVGDPLRVRQVLVNLLGNAIKFTEIGQVLLEVKPAPDASEAGALCFTVIDTGIGISKDKLGTIFQSFTQEDSSTTRRFGGSGLGLAIAQRLVSLMGGQIWVESQHGEGSRFSFTCKFGLAPRVISASTDVLLSLDGYRVLVVDDNQINRMIVHEMIASCGAKVTEAASGPDALAAIRAASNERSPFHIVLLDMKMPEMDGLEVATRIHQEHLPIEPLVLMLSSDDLKPQISRLRDLGLDAYLVKPVTRKELFEAISRVIKAASRANSRSLPAPTARPMAAGDQPERAKVLVVDDSPDNRMLVGAYLRREPYDLDFAVDGKEAVALFMQHEYAIVLMDIQMPEMDGLTATRLIRKFEKDGDRLATPIVALTASALEDDVKRSFAAGCTAHVSKPVRKALLLETLRGLGAPRTGRALNTSDDAAAT